MATCTPEQIARSVANYKRRRDERRAVGLCICTAPLAVREDGTLAGHCETCLENMRLDAKAKRGRLPRTCGCGKRGRHRAGCKGVQ